ncbi:hypothetical protein IMSAGC009_02978 [Lachnospiraceae bacterium]|nr:hypothetical protein IMSAGC009_02978 [Lachnospiraceae bacterium]
MILGQAIWKTGRNVVWKMLLIANLYGSSLVKLRVMAYNKRKPENKDKGAVEIKLYIARAKFMY